MDNAGLHLRLAPGRLDRGGQAVEPVAADEQDVLDAAVAELGEHARPEPRSLRRGQPDAQHVLEPVRVDAGDQVGGLVVHYAAIADLHYQGVDVKNGVKGIQRPVLPFCDLVGHHVGHRRYQRGRNLHPVDLRQVRVDVPRGHPAGVKRQDHLIDLADAPLPFHHDLRLECRLPVTGHRDPHRPRRRGERLPEGAVPGIPRPVSPRVAFHVAQVIVHFRAQRPLDNPRRQLPDQPARPVQQRNAGVLRVGDHPVDRRVADEIRQPLRRGFLRGERHFLQALARHALGDDFLHLFGLFRAHSGCPLRQRNIRHTGITCTLPHK